MTEARRPAGCRRSWVRFNAILDTEPRSPLTLPLSPRRGEGSHDLPASSVFQPIPAYSNVFSTCYAERPAYSRVFQRIPAYSRIKKFSPDTNVTNEHEFKSKSRVPIPGPQGAVSEKAIGNTGAGGFSGFSTFFRFFHLPCRRRREETQNPVRKIRDSSPRHPRPSWICQSLSRSCQSREGRNQSPSNQIKVN